MSKDLKSFLEERSELLKLISDINNKDKENNSLPPEFQEVLDATNDGEDLAEYTNKVTNSMRKVAARARKLQRRYGKKHSKVVKLVAQYKKLQNRHAICQLVQQSLLDKEISVTLLSRDDEGDKDVT